jgi:hypothetical protein
VTNLNTHQTAWIAFEEHFCVKSGRFGLRTLNANATWRNISIEPASWNDYHELAKHAALVEHPVIVNGPPWWTPWHVGMLFIGALALSLMIQLAYFRFKNWETNKINRERERLAHEIHDTMAQGFAGVGYQIQGIGEARISGLRTLPSRSCGRWFKQVDTIESAVSSTLRQSSEATRQSPTSQISTRSGSFFTKCLPGLSSKAPGTGPLPHRISNCRFLIR